jgi:hypothetical protein
MPRSGHRAWDGGEERPTGRSAHCGQATSTRAMGDRRACRRRRKPQSARRPYERCRVVFKVTWNVENLFKPGAVSGPPSQAVYEAKLQGLASTINNEAPDAVALQEIADSDALDDLVERLTGTWHSQASKHPSLTHCWVCRGAMASRLKARTCALDDPGVPVNRLQ